LKILTELTYKSCLTNYADHLVLNLVKWHNLVYIHEKRVAFEMFKAVTSGPEHTLSSFFETYESSRKGLIKRMRRMNTEFSRQSLSFKGPVEWNGPNNNTRNPVNKDLFKRVLMQCKEINQIGFQKGTCVNLNKNIEDFIYF